MKDFPSSNTSGTPTQDIVYAYDLLNHLIARTVYLNGGTTPATVDSFVYFGDQILAQFTSTNGATPTISRRFLNGNAVDQVFAEEDATKTLTDPGRVLFTVDDNLGSTRGLNLNDSWNLFLSGTFSSPDRRVRIP